MTEQNRVKNNQAYGFIIGELSFILLPFLVMTLIYIYKNNLNHLLKEPEWSLTASVLFGQSIIKLIHTIIKAGKDGKAIKHYNVGAFISLLILFG